MKKLWQQTIPLVASGLILSAGGITWQLVSMEIKFHVQVNERLAAIEQKLGISNEKDSHVAANN